MNDLEADLLIANAKIAELEKRLSASQRREQETVNGLTLMREGNLCASCGAECSSRDKNPRLAASVCLWWENKWRGPQEAGKGETE